MNPNWALGGTQVMAISSSQVREGLEGQGIRPNPMTKYSSRQNAMHLWAVGILTP